MNRAVCVSWCVLILLWLAAAPARAQQPPPAAGVDQPSPDAPADVPADVPADAPAVAPAKKPGSVLDKQEPPEPQIAAYVNGAPIYVAEVEAGMHAALGRRQMGDRAAALARARILDQLIKRSLCTQALEQAGTYIEPGEVDREMEKADRQVGIELGLSLERFARTRGLTVEALRQQAVWRLGWTRYLDRNLANAMERYFKVHQRELDGTEVRVSHILLRPEKFTDTHDDLEARAAGIRADIESGKLSFEDAVAKYSDAPSRGRGGDLGFIVRRGTMMEPFAKAAFALEVGQISEPVTTVFGTHLVRVTEVKKGTREWTQAIPQIRAVASGDLLDKLSEEQRATAKIEFTGNTPHFKPGTEELAEYAGPARPPK